MSYNFVDKDPIIDQMRTLIEDAGVSWLFIERHSGVSRSCLRAWFKGKTRRPQHPTVKAVLRSIGYDYQIVKVGGVKEEAPAPAPTQSVVPLRARREKVVPRWKRPRHLRVAASR
jgi:hypothetical protein